MKFSTNQIIIAATVIIIIVVLIIYARSRKMLTPVEGRISSGFGMRFHPILKENKMHNGIDISAPSGTDIKAPQSGLVIARRSNSVGGNELILDHGNGLTTGYSHLSAFNVEEGDRVRRGQVIGKVGTTGRSTGPHLHFSVKKNGVFVDPKKYL